MLTPTVSRQHPAQTPARRFAKGHVSGSERWSFIMQKTMFCNAKGTFCNTSANALTIRRITICKLSARTTASDGLCSTTGYRPA